MLQDSVVPSFFLFGEAPQEVSDRFIHLEALDDRSRPSHWNIRAHAHAELNHIFLIETGGGEMFAEAQRIAFIAPCLLVIPAGVVHGFAYEPETTGRVLTMAEAYLRDLMRRESGFRALFGGSAAQLPLAADHDIADCLARLHRELAWTAPGHAAAVEAQLLSVLVTALRASHEAADTAPAEDVGAARLVARFREAVEADYRSGAAVEAYAERLGVTPTRLRRACWSAARTTPSRLIQDRLLLEAKRALLYSNMTVAETAYYLGFDDPAYFSRFFAQRERQSPRAFRQGAGRS